MNQFKHGIQTKLTLRYNPLPWMRTIEKWRKCLSEDYNKDRLLYEDPIKLCELKRLGNTLKFKLPVCMDSKQHCDYEQIPSNYEALIFRNTSFNNDELSIDDNKLKNILPSNSPYIPTILQCLINHLEDNEINLELIYSKNQSHLSCAKRILSKIISTDGSMTYTEINDLIRPENLYTITCAVLLFVRVICDLMSENKNETYFTIAQQSICFLNIHLLHICEFSIDPLHTLLKLSEVFGPILYKPNDDGISNCIKEFKQMLTINKYDYWYKLSQEPSKLLQLFNGVTVDEQKVFGIKHFI